MKPRHAPLPLFGLRKNQTTTNEQVFRILSRSYPKTVAALKADLAHEFKQKLSYQAVRKSVMALQGLGVLEHGQSGYQLSLDWLLQVRSVIDDTLLRYRYAKGISLNEEVDHQVFTGNSLYEIDTLWGDIVVSVCRNTPKGSPRRFISINHYPWWVPMNVGHETEFCHTLQGLGFEVVFVFLVQGASARWAADFYQSLGVSVIVRNTTALPRTHYYNVIGDAVIEVVLPQHLEHSIHDLFGRSKKLEGIAPQALTHLAQQKAQIRISVQKSKAFALGLLHSLEIDEALPV